MRTRNFPLTNDASRPTATMLSGMGRGGIPRVRHMPFDASGAGEKFLPAGSEFDLAG
jgi:hypothetical protein